VDDFAVGYGYYEHAKNTNGHS